MDPVVIDYLFESLQQGWSDGGHVVGMESNTSTTDFFRKDSFLFQLQHKFTDCFLSKHTHTQLVKIFLRKKNQDLVLSSNCDPLSDVPQSHKNIIVHICFCNLVLEYMNRSLGQNTLEKYTITQTFSVDIMQIQVHHVNTKRISNLRTRDGDCVFSIVACWDHTLWTPF